MERSLSKAFRLALLQAQSPQGDEGAAFAAIEQAAAASSTVSADLLLCPEAFLPGYNLGQMVSQPIDGPWVAQLSAIARRHAIAIVCGFSEQSEGNAYNSAVAVGVDGEVMASFRKVQLWGDREKSIWTPGDGFTTFDFRGRRIGMLICYDVEFPEHVRALVRRGVDLVLVPTANPEPFDNVNRFSVPARAMENAITVAYANYCGPDGDITFCGRSLVAGPEGEPLASAGTSPALLITDIPAASGPLDRPAEHLNDLREIE